MLNKDQYARMAGLEYATKIVASGCINKEKPYGSWSEEAIYDLADKFADYIQYGRQDAPAAG
jgi:hypothetical protein